MDSDFRKNISSFYLPVDMPGGWSFDHAKTLKTIDAYYNSRFTTGQYDARGFRKFFVNIVKPACDVASKFVDLDTKDLSLIPTKAEDELRVWFMQRKFRQWLRDNHVPAFLNEITAAYPKYGHVVIRRSSDGWKVVPLQNLRMDTTARKLKESPWVYEVYVMSRADIEATPWDEKAKEELLATNQESYIIYDCLHRKGKKWDRYIKAGLTSYKKDGRVYQAVESMLDKRDDYLPSITLFEETITKFPYRELKWEDVPGRWLGMGFVEYLENNQVATNEAENLERKGLAHKALQLWQTRDETIGGKNLLVNQENGDILKVDSEVTPVAKDNSDLAAFGSTRNRWDKNTKEKTFSFESATGENLPSRTPLGVANLQASMIASYFDLKRENYGIFLRDWIIEDVIPDFKKESRKEHVLTFLGSDDELDKLDQVITEILIDKAKADHAMETGFFPNQMQVDEARQRITASLKKNKNRYLEVPDNFYENASFIVDVNVTGEAIDVSAQSSIIQLALQTIATNPSVLSQPQSKQAFFKLLELGGVSPVDLNLMKEAPAMPMMPQGGSLAATNMPSAGMAQQTTSL